MNHKLDIKYAGVPLEKAKKALIMLHGRGATAESILSLGEHLNVDDYALIAPQATNNTWYPYSFMAPEQENEPWLSSAINIVNQTVDKVLQSGIKSEDIYFLGFSQGACLATEYATLKKKADGSLPTYEEVKAVYDKYYKNEKFVRVLEKGVLPETKWVEGSNYVDINFVIDERTGRIIMMGAIDNLVKGAAGQAVQNMNILFGFDEAEGLNLVPMFP